MKPGDVEFNCSVYELKRRMDEGDHVFLLDVREPDEYETVNLGGKLISLGELPARLPELDPSQEMIVYCHHGVRSVTAVNYLRANGCLKARNLAGGIDRWSVDIDPTVRRY